MFLFRLNDLTVVRSASVNVKLCNILFSHYLNTTIVVLRWPKYGLYRLGLVLIQNIQHQNGLVMAVST